MPDAPNESPALSPDEPPGRPRWVKIIALVGAVLVLAAVGLALAGGEHSPGPGGHFGGDDPAPGRTAPPEGGSHTPPPGAHD